MNILTHNEARQYLRDGTLPENFRERVENVAEFGEIDPSPILTKFEAECFLAANVPPFDFYHRVEASLSEKCRNCDDRKCMACVLREWDGDHGENCPNCCESSIPAE